MLASLKNTFNVLGDLQSIVSLLLLISGGLMLACFGSHRMRWPALVISVTTVALTALEVIANQFSGRGFDASVIYHLRYGFEGAGLKEFMPLIVGDTLTVACVLALFVWAVGRSGRATRHVASRVGMGFLTTAFFLNPTLPKVTAAMQSVWFRPAVQASSLKSVDGYVQPQGLAPTPGATPNIVWIYAESLERTYFDETVFPGLTPELRKLEAQALSLTNLSQVSGASWTIAGMVASQCGLPLITGGAHGNSMGAFDRFLPGALCLGDMLAARGYQLHYSAGASLAFAGKGKFYRDHGFTSRRGREEFQQLLPPGETNNSWGVHDATLFEHLKEEFSQLVAARQPFGLFALTLDTHHPKGLPSPVCADRPYRDGSNPILNAVHCSDRMLAELIQELQRRDPSGNTLFVLTSDHLAMPNTAMTLLQTLPRRNLALYLWPGRIVPAQDASAHSTLDTGATALKLMGYGVTALAFGRAAGTPATSLAALPDLEKRLQEATPKLLTLWDLPERLDSLNVQPLTHTALLNGMVQPLPLLIGVRADGSIQKLFSPDERSKLKTRADLLTTTQDCAELKWIEHCDKVNTALTGNASGGSSWCVWDWQTDRITRLDNDVTLKPRNGSWP